MATNISGTVPGNPGTPRSLETWRLPWRILAVCGLITVLFLAAFVLTTRDDSRSGVPLVPAGAERVVYAQFGPYADTIFESSVEGAIRRREIIEIPHAPEFGIVPALAPDGAHFAYTVLAPNTRAPSPSAPAEIWIASATGEARRLGEGFDLLVRPVWRADGAAFVLRRSDGDGGPFYLVQVNPATGAQLTLVRSAAALFPVGYTDEGLYYASIDESGTDILLLAAEVGRPTVIAHLSDGLARDWTLSPAGDFIAFLSLAPTANGFSSSVHILDVRSAEVVGASLEGPDDEFGPAWSPQGQVTYGWLSADEGASGLVIGGSAVASAAPGFDAPLAWSKSGSRIALRSFEGSSLTSPGRASLAVLRPTGERQTIAIGEVTFLGWIYR